MKKIIYVANVDCGKEMSGGSTIYIQFLKNWDKHFHTYFFGSRGTIKRLQKENIRNIWGMIRFWTRSSVMNIPVIWTMWKGIVNAK